MLAAIETPNRDTVTLTDAGIKPIAELATAKVELWIYAPGYRFTIGTGSIEGASPEILLKVKCI
jgi:hypothetical protein